MSLHFVYLADKPETSARQCPDESLRFAGVADRAPDSVNARGQSGLRDDPPAPDRREDIVLADDPVPVADEVGQEVKDLRLQGTQAGSAAQLTPVASNGTP